MALSNEEKIQFAAKLARKREAFGGDALVWLSNYRDGLIDAMGISLGEPVEKLIEMISMTRDMIIEIRDQAHQDRVEMTRGYLAGYESRAEKIECLHRMAWTLEEAFDEGLLGYEDPATLSDDDIAIEIEHVDREMEGLSYDDAARRTDGFEMLDVRSSSLRYEQDARAKQLAHHVRSATSVAECRP